MVNRTVITRILVTTWRSIRNWQAATYEGWNRTSRQTATRSWHGGSLDIWRQTLEV